MTDLDLGLPKTPGQAQAQKPKSVGLLGPSFLFISIFPYAFQGFSAYHIRKVKALPPLLLSAFKFLFLGRGLLKIKPQNPIRERAEENEGFCSLSWCVMCLSLYLLLVFFTSTLYTIHL